MKAEINNENKAKFFALYWGQSLLPVSYWGSNNKIDEGVFYSKNTREFESSWLDLKPLSQISDEDAKVIDLQSAEDYSENGWWDKHGDFYYWASFDVDFLRSKGYAIPWMRLSVEEIVEAGWIKLTE